MKKRGAKLSTDPWPLVFGMALAAVLLVCLRALFLYYSPAIIAAKPVVAPTEVTLWVRWAIVEHDGIETYVALAGTFVFLTIVGVLVWGMELYRWRPCLSPVATVGAMCAAYLVLGTRSSEFFFPKTAGATFLLGGATVLLLWLWFEAHQRAPLRVKQTAAGGASVLAVALIIASTPFPSATDYCYYIGPALKHLRGEPLGSFYMQYNLGGTLLFEGMMALGWRLHQMALALSLILFGWFVLYWALTRRLFSTPFLGWLCLVTVFVVRFLSIRDHPTFCPQTLPLRLDLWVLGILAIDRWGVRSWKTGSVFGILYAFDSTFGFLSAGVYGCTVLGTILAEREWRFPWKELLPLVIAACWNRWLFGSFTSAAAARYLGLQLGMLPISPVSLFWPIALVLAWATVVFVQRREERSSRIGLVICMLSVVHLTYFFGRSHDHNLLHLAGAWVLPAFLAIDQAGTWLRARVALAAGVVALFVAMGAQQAGAKWQNVHAAWTRGSWIEEHPNEKLVEAYRPIAQQNLLLMHLDDAYFNYRLDLPQRGYFSPFGANVFQDETARFLDQEMKLGHQVLSCDPRLPDWINCLNENRLGLKFAVYSDGQLFEVRRGPQ